MARRLLEAAGAREPDPRTVWGLLDPSLRALFPSYRGFAREMRATPYDPVHDPAAADVTYVGRGFAGHPRPPERVPLLWGSLEQLCGEGIAERVASSYWFVLVVYPETVGACAGCGTDLFFLTRPDGIRYWTAV